MTTSNGSSIGRTLTVATLIAALCGLLGYGIGVGRWGGNIEAVQAAQTDRLDANERRDDRQDDHMRRIDEIAADTRETLAAIERDVAALLRATVPAQ